MTRPKQNLLHGEKQNGGNIALIAGVARALNLSLDEICGINARPAESNEQDIKNKILNAIKTLIDLDKSQIRLSKQDHSYYYGDINLNITINMTLSYALSPQQVKLYSSVASQVPLYSVSCTSPILKSTVQL